ncbi:M24 family metallopeptidase [Peristeroidobacter soli]|uniref:M24 family metallopeptidase n=1 Tax=Peristeroidobacter soli TaxID=2497877 RepID=UPI001588E535|nr:Xaa-Pro peptidase family protein [Peristeroidobacter soli]
MAESTIVLAFTTAEFQRRVAAVKQLMAGARIDVLLISDPANMNYLTGYNAFSYYTHQMVAVALDENEPLWLGRKMDVACARFTAFMGEDRLFGYPESYIGVSARHPMEFIGKVLRDKGWERRVFGLEMDSAPLTPRCADQLKHALPEARWVDADLLVNRARLVKSKAEIDYLRQAAQISQRAMQAAHEAIEVGVRECDVAAKVYSALVSGTEGYAGHLTMQGGLAMPSGERTSAPHLGWTDERYHSQQLVSIELGGCRHGYHAGLSRSFFLGRPPAELQRCAEVTIDGMSEVLVRMRAGTTCGEVADHWNGLLKRAGLAKESRIGYSIGIGYPLTSWIDKSASLQSGDATVLQPDMTFHIILGMWMDRWGFELSETVRVTEGEVEVFSSFPRALLIKA